MAGWFPGGGGGGFSPQVPTYNPGDSGSGYQIGGSIPFGPGGNPFQGTDLNAIAQQYQTGYNNALQQNQAMYGNIMQGYQGLTSDVMGALQGIGQAGQQQINDQYAQAAGATTQGLIGRGLGNTTVADSLQRGVMADRAKAQQGLQEQIAQLYAGNRSNLGLNQLNWMNSVTAKYPNAQDYYGIFKDRGNWQQAQEDRAAINKANQSSRGSGFGGGGGGSAIPRGWSEGQTNPFSMYRTQDYANSGSGYYGGGPGLYDQFGNAGGGFGGSTLDLTGGYTGLGTPQGANEGTGEGGPLGYDMYSNNALQNSLGNDLGDYSSGGWSDLGGDTSNYDWADLYA